MNTNETQMKVYAVIGGGWHSDAEDFTSLRLFDCKSTAEAYKKELLDVYDYVLIEVKEVNMESAIAA